MPVSARALSVTWMNPQMKCDCPRRCASRTVTCFNSDPSRRLKSSIIVGRHQPTVGRIGRRTGGAERGGVTDAGEDIVAVETAEAGGLEFHVTVGIQHFQIGRAHV